MRHWKAWLIACPVAYLVGVFCGIFSEWQTLSRSVAMIGAVGTSLMIGARCARLKAVTRNPQRRLS